MKRRTILILTLIPASLGLLAMGGVDDKIISSRGSLFLNIDADDNEGGQLLEIARDTTGGGVGGTPLVTVLETGEVGIGTTDPFRDLHIRRTSPSTAGMVRIEDESNGAYWELGMTNDAGDNNFELWHFDGSTVTKPFRIAQNGAAYFFEPGNTTGDMVIGSPGGWPGLIANAEDGGTYSMKFQNSGVSLGAGPSEFFWLDEDDRVGIGTKSPESKLHVWDSSGDVHLIVEADPDNTNEHENPGIRLVQDGGRTEGRLIFNNNNHLHIELYEFSKLVHDVILTPSKFSVEVLEIRGGGDLVEGFETSDVEIAEPGTVMVIDPHNPGALMTSAEAYDAKVAGVVSGAGGVNPGILLGQESVLEGDTKVAMTGRVYVKCSTENGAIRPGDRLTTASLAGHAMKATDAARCDGAVIGKAMSGLDEQTGLVLVLVNLQ